MKMATVLWAPLEITINRYLRMDPDAFTVLTSLEGKVIGIEFRGFDVAFFLKVGKGAIHVLGDYEGEPDTRLVGTPIALTKLGLSSQGGDGLFAGDVEIRGDIETGRRFKRFLDGIDIDWEEQLSHLVGDVIAHQVGNAVRGAVAWGRQAVDTISQDAAEYLQEESRDLPRPEEVEAFLGDVDVLRADADRLAARVKRLQERVQDEASAKPSDSDTTEGS